MALDIDLNKLRSLAMQEQDEANNHGGSNREDSPYKIFYPGENGSFRVKLLYNVPAGIIQRKILRHDTGKGKVPCLQSYHESCPVCDTIREIENALGKDIGAYRKYGYKVRGICYAQIIALDDTYLKRDGHPEIGDVVLFMYPVSLYNRITDIIVDSGDHLEDLVCKNMGKSIVIERSQKGQGAPQYSASVYPYGDESFFKDGSDPEHPEMTGDEQFENMVNAIPDLEETIVPKYPTDKIREDIKALAETINAEYMDGSIMNPGDEPKEEHKVEASSVAEIAGATTPSASAPTPAQAPATAPETTESSSAKPSCYGQHSDTERKCMLCAVECECIADSE